jgi:ethanolamine ammonia-lyase large subunit
MLGCGDAGFGVSPASDNVETILDLNESNHRLEGGDGVRVLATD